MLCRISNCQLISALGWMETARLWLSNLQSPLLGARTLKLMAQPSSLSTSIWRKASSGTGRCPYPKPPGHGTLYLVIWLTSPLPTGTHVKSLHFARNLGIPGMRHLLEFSGRVHLPGHLFLSPPGMSTQSTQPGDREDFLYLENTNNSTSKMVIINPSYEDHITHPKPEEEVMLS